LQQTIKAIFFDIDGTLITNEKVISKNVISEIHRVRDLYKIPMFYISARMPKAIHTVADNLKLNEIIIAYTGALILDNKSTIRESFIAEAVSSKIVQEAVNAEIEYIGLYSYDNWYVNSDNYWTQREIRATKVQPEILAVEKVAGSKIQKIMLRDVPEKISVIVEKLRSFAGVNVFKTQANALEIFDNSCSKAVSVKYMARQLHIPLENIMAFGDSEGDKEMLQSVGFGIAMGNADESIKKIAFEVTLSNDEDGIAHTLKKYFP
jgi:Cof subfamily protein (haloacid dehalogenase superfamily)